MIPSAPVLTGGVPSGCGVLRAPELVIGGSELWSGGAGGRMMLLLPPIGLAACALPAERSKAAAAAKIGNADFIGVTPCRKTVAQPRICASGIGVGMRRLASGSIRASKTKGPGGTPRLSGLCETLGCQPPLLVPPPVEPMPLLAPLLVLPPLLVLGVLMLDAKVPVLGLAAVPELFSEGNAAFGL